MTSDRRGRWTEQLGRQGGMRRRTDEGRREGSKGKKYSVGEGEAETETMGRKGKRET